MATTSSCHSISVAQFFVQVQLANPVIPAKLSEGPHRATHAMARTRATHTNQRFKRLNDIFATPTSGEHRFKESGDLLAAKH